MKYIVMECHLSYAILLDENGRFIKAANLHYEPGQTVTDIIEMKESPARTINRRFNTILAVAIACFIFIITSYINHQTYASIFMVINPEVRVDVNRKNIVIGLEGINADGQNLIKDYSYHKKSLEPVMDELVDLAIEMGYLSNGEHVTLSFDTKDHDWVSNTGNGLQTHMKEHVADKISIHVEISNSNTVSPPAPAESENNIVNSPQTIVIPAAPAEEDSSKGDSAYGESDYGDLSDEDEDYDLDDGISDYEPENDSVTNYADSEDHSSNYEETDDDISNYEEPQDSSSSYDTGNSGYDHDDGSDDGASSYEVSSYDEVDSDDEDSEDDDEDKDDEDDE